MANPNIKAVITAEDKASAVLKGFAKNTDTLGNKMATGLKRVAVAATAATTAIGVLSINQFKDIQKNVAGIQALTKNTQEAKKVLNDVISFVKGKPFDRLETLGAAKQLLAMGRTSRQLNEDLRILGKTVIISGQDWQQLSRIYGKVSSSNRLMNDDILILEQSIPIVSTLGKQLGVTNENVRKMASEGKISFAQFKAALDKAAPDSAVQNAMGTLDNKMISLKASIRDVAFQILGVDFNSLEKGGEPLVKKGGLLDKLTDMMDNFVRFLRSPEFQAGLNKFVEWLTVHVPPAINYMTQTLIPSLVNIFKTLWPVIRTVLDWTGKLITFIGENTWIVWGFVAAFAALKTAMAISKAVAAFEASMAVMRGSIALTKKSFIILRALLLSPISLPALAIGAVLGSLALIAAKARETINVLRSVRGNIADNNQTINNNIQALIARTKSPYSSEVQSRARQALRHMGIQGYAQGGFTGAGNANELAGVVHKGEYVVPRDQVDQSTGRPKGTSNINITIQAGAFMGSEVEARKFANQILNHLRDIAASKGTTLNGMMS